MLGNGTINTKSGCLLTGKDITTASETRDAEQKQAEKAKQENAARDDALHFEKQK